MLKGSIAGSRAALPIERRKPDGYLLVYLVRKGGYLRIIPVPDWVYRLLNDWTAAAGIQAGKLFRKVNSAGNPNFLKAALARATRVESRANLVSEDKHSSPFEASEGTRRFI